MKHKIKVTVIDKKLYPELQEKYCADSKAGVCPCYNVGDEFIFERDGDKDDFWHMGLNTLVKTNGNPDTVAGETKNTTLFRSLGCNSKIYLYRVTRWLNYERMDERRKYNDYLLF